MSQHLSAFITGVAGPELTPEETAFLRDACPCGLILFDRNLADRDQVRRLIASFRAAVGSADALVLIDQEGGRVQRLRPPLGRRLPPAAAYAALHADAGEAAAHARAVSRLVAHDLASLGITMNCAPCLDVPVPGSHGIIGDRAYSTDPASVALIGRAVAEGHLAGGVVPVIKHIPGHGRATKDSHHDLPVVTASRAELEAQDFAPFRSLADMPAAMTAHVVFTAFDDCLPASTSPHIIGEVVRGTIGFEGLVMSDDLGMRALSGSLADRARAVLVAGSDVALHCSGRLAEMQEVAAAVPSLSGAALARFGAAVSLTHRRQPFDQAAAETLLGTALAGRA